MINQQSTQLSGEPGAARCEGRPRTHHGSRMVAVLSFDARRRLEAPLANVEDRASAQ